jgi:hypothetical protein
MSVGMGWTSGNGGFPGPFVFLAYRLEMISSSLDAPFPMSIVTTSMRYDGTSSPPRPFLTLATGSGGVFELFRLSVPPNNQDSRGIGSNLWRTSIG